MSDFERQPGSALWTPAPPKQCDRLTGLCDDCRERRCCSLDEGHAGACVCVCKESESPWRPGQVVEVAGEGERYVLRHPCTCCGKAWQASPVARPHIEDVVLTVDLRATKEVKP